MAQLGYATSDQEDESPGVLSEGSREKTMGTPRFVCLAAVLTARIIEVEVRRREVTGWLVVDIIALSLDMFTSVYGSG